MQVRAEAKGLELGAELRGPLPETILTDPTRLRQILINLMGNALKFTEQGEVRLRVRFLDGTPPAGDGGASPTLEFAVSDTGIGIAPTQLAVIFEPFRQADGSTTRRFGGTGLGLAISRRLAENLGGTIAVESEVGRGTTFRLLVPANPLEGVPLLAEPSLTEQAHPTDTGVTSSPLSEPLDCRVLLVEDAPDNQRLLSFILRRAGAEVEVVGDGRAAVDRLVGVPADAHHTPPDARFDVVLMDMQMPVLDGYEATRRLRAAGYVGSIIALTAHAMEGDCAKCLQAGCDGYATKPIDSATLLQTIRGHLRERCPERPAR